MIKDTNEQPGEKILRARFGRVLSIGVQLSTEVGYVPLWYMNVLKLSEPHIFGIFMQACLHGHDPSLTLFPILFLFLENEG